jgi:hypothetical protein
MANQLTAKPEEFGHGRDTFQHYLGEQQGGELECPVQLREAWMTKSKIL